jgi:hypothetical protein
LNRVYNSIPNQPVDQLAKDAYLLGEKKQNELLHVFQNSSPHLHGRSTPLLTFEIFGLSPTF